jgi:hypothetical protein
MSQHSEDRLEESAPAPSTSQSARILPFERPQSDLQRAIQLRAQQTLDVERDRDREARKPAPLRWLIIFAIATIPVVLILGAVDAFLRVFHKVNEMYQSAPVAEQPAPATTEPTTSAPGVVILQSYGDAPSAPRSERAPDQADPESKAR